MRVVDDLALTSKIAGKISILSGPNAPRMVLLSIYTSQRKQRQRYYIIELRHSTV